MLSVAGHLMCFHALQDEDARVEQLGQTVPAFPADYARRLPGRLQRRRLRLAGQGAPCDAPMGSRGATASPSRSISIIENDWPSADSIQDRRELPTQFSRG